MRTADRAVTVRPSLRCTAHRSTRVAVLLTLLVLVLLLLVLLLLLLVLPVVLLLLHHVHSGTAMAWRPSPA